MKSKKIALLLIMVLFLCSCGINPSGEVSSASSESGGSSEAISSDASSQPQQQKSKVSISFAGDILIHTPLYSSAKTSDGYDFIPFIENMKGFFDSDLNIANVENPVDVNGDNSKISTYPNFNAPREIMDALKYMGVDTVTHVNNHVYDKGYKGFVATVNNLRENFDVVGAYLSEEEYNTPHIREVNGIKIGMLAYTDHVNGYSPSRLTPYSLRTFDYTTDDSLAAVLSDVDELRENGAEFIIVFLHWGSEYVDKPSNRQVKFAHALTDAGVDIIAGTHSHCVQPIERRVVTYNGQEKESIIMYSLGNFFADQTGLQSSRGASYIKTQQGMKVTVEIEKDPASGKISFTDAEYTPTMLFRKNSGDKYDYKLLAIGEYAEADKRPDVFWNNAAWQNCISAWSRVRSVVGDEIKVS